jgi:hypothetical protein
MGRDAIPSARGRLAVTVWSCYVLPAPVTAIDGTKPSKPLESTTGRVRVAQENGFSQKMDCLREQSQFSLKANELSRNKPKTKPKTKPFLSSKSFIICMMVYIWLAFMRNNQKTNTLNRIFELKAKNCLTSCRSHALSARRHNLKRLLNNAAFPSSGTTFTQGCDLAEIHHRWLKMTTPRLPDIARNS